MKRKSKLIICLMAFTLLGIPQVVSAENTLFSFENNVGEVRMNIKNTTVRIQNASNKTLEVYNITGVRIAQHKIDSSDKTIELNLQRGCYILKIDKVVRKISIL